MNENGQPPEVGAVVLDMARDRVGVVMRVDGRLVALRPGGGGAQWQACLADVCPAAPLDELRAKVAEINALRMWFR